MPDFFYTAISSEGHKVTDLVVAETAKDAHAQLVGSGHTEIVMHSDDISARYVSYSKSNKALTPQEFLEASRTRGRWQLFIFQLKYLVRKNVWIAILAILILAILRMNRSPVTLLDAVLIFLVFWPLLLAVASMGLLRSSSRQIDMFTRLIEARAWGRWEDVLELANQVTGAPAEEVAFQKATALAGLGRIEEGLEHLKPFSDGQRIPRYLYCGRLGDLYSASGRYLEAVRCAEEAIAEAPDLPLPKLELAMGLLRVQQDVPRCRELAEQVRQYPLSEVPLMCLKYLDAVIALESQQPQVAHTLMQEAFQLFQPLSQLSPLMGSLRDRMHAYMALIEKKLGNTAAAARHYRQAIPRMNALKAKDMIDRCQTELGAGVIEYQE